MTPAWHQSGPGPSDSLAPGDRGAMKENYLRMRPFLCFLTKCFWQSLLLFCRPEPAPPGGPRPCRGPMAPLTITITSKIGSLSTALAMLVSLARARGPGRHPGRGQASGPP